MTNIHISILDTFEITLLKTALFLPTSLYNIEISEYFNLVFLWQVVESGSILLIAIVAIAILFPTAALPITVEGHWCLFFKSVPLIYFGKMTSALSPMIWHVVTWCNCYDLLWRRYWCCLLWFSFLCLFQSDWSGAALFSGQGLAFQLIDDVLDFTGTSASLGKGSLSDIRNVILFSLMYNVNVEKFSWAWKVHWSKDINVVDRSVRKSAIFLTMFLQLS